ncbi:HepT-like ribonuclease domain-containing protein [Nitrosomonas nitrosa]|nr:HepT-like ribonuclease domain-containing protein [Nitrosomonas nitrosa]
MANDHRHPQPCLIHGYLGIDDDTLWSIIQDDVPGLLSMLKALKNEAQS